MQDRRIPARDLEWTFMRSSGPGGQNVNKVASAAQLRFLLASNATLAPAVKQRLRHLAGRRLADDGSIVIVARTERSQEQNRRAALERLEGLVERALLEPKLRKRTAPTRASRERRIDAKKRRGAAKRGRSGSAWE
ncbi:MAG TPA: alternative ribosome rescue aminoacyl-tRNA hydrolase ArfB [Steroidobacteraceae bacterium]|nr:alternative ribosome rescue aminoacyl-tRNA hydrolase ArfB [Steroidobacteraceae bacterium]